MKRFWILPLLLLAKVVLSQTDTSMVKFVNPSAVSTPHGYSHVAEIDLGTCKMLTISGQVALDDKGNLVGASDYEKQTEQIFLNIKNIIESAGGKMDNLVKLGYFT